MLHLGPFGIIQNLQMSPIQKISQDQFLGLDFSYSKTTLEGESQICDYATDYSFWDQLRKFLHKFTWIVLSVHKLNKLGKFMDNCWISCQVIADMKKVYDDLTIINLYYTSSIYST